MTTAIDQPTNNTDSYTLPATCTTCGTSFTKIIHRGLMEKWYLRHGTCPACDAIEEEADRRRRAEEEAKRAEERWQWHLAENLPLIYQRAEDNKVTPTLAAIFDWSPDTAPGGIALIGQAGSGKSSAAACLVKRLRGPFVWWSGTEARQAAIEAATDRDNKAKGAWEAGFKIGLLVIDDLSQAKFTEAWSSALFGLLEHRLSRLKPTVWTSQLGEAALYQKIAAQNGGDTAQADAIARRLFQHSLVIHA